MDSSPDIDSNCMQSGFPSPRERCCTQEKKKHPSRPPFRRHRHEGRHCAADCTPLWHAQQTNSGLLQARLRVPCPWLTFSTELVGCGNIYSKGRTHSVVSEGFLRTPVVPSGALAALPTSTGLGGCASTDLLVPQRSKGEDPGRSSGKQSSRFRTVSGAGQTRSWVGTAAVIRSRKQRSLFPRKRQLFSTLKNMVFSTSSMIHTTNRFTNAK